MSKHRLATRSPRQARLQCEALEGRLLPSAVPLIGLGSLTAPGLAAVVRPVEPPGLIAQDSHHATPAAQNSQGPKELKQDAADHTPVAPGAGSSASGEEASERGQREASHAEENGEENAGGREASHGEENAGGLAEKEQVRVGPAPTSVLVQDVSSNGRLDLVATNGGDGGPLGLSAVGGQLDVAPGEEGSTAGMLFTGEASSGTTAQTILTGGAASPAALAIGANSRTDLIAANFGGGQPSLLAGTVGGLPPVQMLQESGMHPVALAGAGLGAPNFSAMNAGHDAATSLRLDVPGTDDPATGNGGPLLEEKTPAPAALLAPEREPGIKLQPLGPAAVGVVPTVVAVPSGTGQQPVPDAQAEADADVAPPGPGPVAAPPAAGFLLPDAGEAEG
jgi:hypothetical protein